MGHVSSPSGSESNNDEILVEECGRARVVILNRPKQLNALSRWMVEHLKQLYEQWEVDNRVSLIIIKGAGRAFCAGGDVAATYHNGNAGQHRQAANYFYTEYTLNYIIGTCKKPYVALLDGIVMGGGAGVSIHGAIRVVTEKTLAKHPKMEDLLQALRNPTQTQKASSQSLQSPRRSRSDHLQRRETSHEQRSNDAKGKAHVVEQPLASIGHRQPSSHGLVNGQDSNEQGMLQTILMPMSNAGCFGGGSVFQAMIRPSRALHGYMQDNAYGAMQAGSSNPMYGNIGVQPGFQCAAGSYGMPGANMGMAGFSQPYAQNLNMASRAGGNFGLVMPLLNAPAYNNLTPKGKPKDYKEGGDKQSSLTPSMEHMTN
ncbi:hypothetical protein L7F22_049046 [Adiantum nelumboides]|nr:hypothetical protein [Adiantum nelumboides]